MKDKEKDKFASEYWICGACAKKHKEWVAPKYAVTGMFGKCGHCKIGIKDMLIPVVDYDRPGKPAVWD